MSKATITVEGFIANELEIKEAGAHRVVEVSVPHTPQRKTESGEWEDSGPTTWFSASFWDEHADGVLSSVEKGALVILTGVPELESYAKRDGSPGGKVLVKSPTIARVARRNARSGFAKADTGVFPASVGSDMGSDVWGAQAGDSSYADSTPF